MAHRTDKGGQAGAASEHAQIALFNLIAAPILRSVDPIQVQTFFKECDRCELEVQRKQEEVP